MSSASQPSFGDIMNFGGSAPELINGRLAMLGFIAAVGAELSSGEESMTFRPALTVTTCRVSLRLSYC